MIEDFLDWCVNQPQPWGYAIWMSVGLSVSIAVTYLVVSVIILTEGWIFLVLLGAPIFGVYGLIKYIKDKRS